ncbi:sugar ABC transporter permease [Metabacillus sediminilitoris]|uniref:Sugar ABC transporter permease n=1 Tax=Metabacillus sediminilitoris TaxID=2567941 RepID=A0A4S4BW72_9BACI|nr:sugar ABC transporter permease [Metabacillus sediminilitoris]QGQ48625.1 ABC transporter permease subunit [Metabacillus sediminilitoris]THF78691.1 sugar ABC transporter permease [Metabacillus sediminilitoris]
MKLVAAEKKVKKKSGHLSLILFVLPAFIFYILFLFIPTIGAGVYSFTDWNGLNKTFNFVGFSNYIEAFRDDAAFRHSFIFTLKYTIFIFVIQNVAALGLALLIESRIKSKGFFRTIFFMPNMISLIISSLMFSFIFTNVFPELSKQAIFSVLDQSWIGDPKVSFYSILIVSLWQGIGYMMVIYMAALQGVPKQLKEAAMIDGANAFQRIIHVVLPMIMHAITICSFLTLNGAFKVFDVVYALTQGGPGTSTQVMALNIYEEAFSNNFRFGYANAKAMILFLVVLIITLIQVRILKRKEVEA